MRKWPKRIQFSLSKMTLHISYSDKRLYKAAIFLIVATTLFSACKKVENNLGVDVLPDSDLLNMEVDTFEVNTYSLREDSLKTDDLSNNLIGSYCDPVFGKTTAGFYTQLKLSTTNSVFDVPNITIDSVVLSLKISGHYGNQTPQTFHVYQLADSLERDSTYYSNSTKALGPELTNLAFNTFTPNVNAKPVIEGDTLDPQIRIHLNNSFGVDYITNAPFTESSFENFCRGLYVTVDTVSNPNDGGIYAVELEHSDSRVTIYYHNLIDTTSEELIINDECARFTHFEHNYNGTEVAQQLADSTLGNQFYYLQAGQGLVANVVIPDLSSLTANGRVIINKAELYLPAQYYTIDPFAPPGRVLAYGLDEEGEIFSMPDFTLLNSSVYGGQYDDVKKAYTFNILLYLQKIINGEIENNPIRLACTSSSVSVNRVILSGKNSPNREKPYFKIYYTKYE